MFLAADQDAWAAGGAMGMAKGQTRAFAADAAGTQAAYFSIGERAASYRTSK